MAQLAYSNIIQNTLTTNMEKKSQPLGKRNWKGLVIIVHKGESMQHKPPRTLETSKDDSPRLTKIISTLGNLGSSVQ